MPESVGADASDMGARSAGNAARSGPGVHGGPPRGRHGSIARQDASRVLGRPAANALRQVPTKNLQPRPERALAPRMGLELPGQLSFEIWLRIGAQLSVAVSSSAWCLGDWLRYGEAAYVSRYRDAIQQTSLDYQTLRTMPGWPGGSRCPAGGTP